MSTIKKGLHASIYRDSYNCPINVMDKQKGVTIIDSELKNASIFEPDEKHPEVKIVRRKLFGSEYIHAEPAKKGSYASGGSFIYSCDSRFRELSKYPIPLHDRDMSKE